MARLTLLLSVLTALVALLGGFRYVVDTLREYRWRKRTTGKWLIVAAIWWCPGIEAQATTINAASCSHTDINTAITSAANGDTVAVPSGSCTWTGQITNQGKAITLQGNGIGNTIITDGQTTASGDSSALLLTTTSAGLLRITGFSFIGRSGISSSNGMLNTRSSSPPSTQIRIDHNYFETQVNGITAMNFFGCPNGVVDHNDFFLRNNAYGAYLNNGMSCLGGNDAQGDEGWAGLNPLGTQYNIFFEDNTYNATVDNTGAEVSILVVDGFRAGRYVVRFNTILETRGVTGHGISSAGRVRGHLNAEVYGNTFNRSGTRNNPVYQGVPSGIGISFDNQATGSYTGAGDFQTYRENTSYEMWTKAGERSITSITRSGTTATVTTAANHNLALAGSYDVYVRVSGATGGDATLYNGHHIVTSAPTATTFTYTMSGTPSGSATGTLLLTSPWDGNSDSDGRLALDQPGAGIGNDMSTDNPGTVNSNACCPPAYPASGLSQAATPWYLINNTVAGVLTGFVSTSSPNTVQANRDYYNHTASFTGATGAGRGLRADRPATCTTGVGYWSTDDSTNWNTSSSNPYGVQRNGADGALDKCTSTNTWTNAAYVPYTYPHPLQSSESAPDSPILFITWAGALETLAMLSALWHARNLIIKGTLVSLGLVAAAKVSVLPYVHTTYSASRTIAAKAILVGVQQLERTRKG